MEAAIVQSAREADRRPSEEEEARESRVRKLNDQRNSNNNPHDRFHEMRLRAERGGPAACNMYLRWYEREFPDLLKPPYISDWFMAFHAHFAAAPRYLESNLLGQAFSAFQAAEEALHELSADLPASLEARLWPVPLFEAQLQMAFKGGLYSHSQVKALMEKYATSIAQLDTFLSISDPQTQSSYAAFVLKHKDIYSGLVSQMHAYQPGARNRAEQFRDAGFKLSDPTRLHEADLRYETAKLETLQQFERTHCQQLFQEGVRSSAADQPPDPEGLESRLSQLAAAKELKSFADMIRFRALAAEMAGRPYPRYSVDKIVHVEALQGWYTLRALYGSVSNQQSPTPEMLQQCTDAEQHFRQALQQAAEGIAGLQSGAANLIQLLEMSMVAYKGLQEISARWRQDPKAALLWMEESRGRAIHLQLQHAAKAVPDLQSVSYELPAVQEVGATAEILMAAWQKAARKLPPNTIVVELSVLNIGSATQHCARHDSEGNKPMESIEDVFPEAEPGIILCALDSSGIVCTKMLDATEFCNSVTPKARLPEALAKAVDSVRKSGENASRPLQKQHAAYEDRRVTLAELHNLLLEPLLQHLEGNAASINNFIFIPDQVLSQVPFSALLNSQSRKYLIQTSTVTTVPSLRTLILALDNPKPIPQTREWMIVSDPRSAEGQVPRAYDGLELMERSVEKIRKLAEGAGYLVNALEGTAAAHTDLSELVKGKSVLQIYSHGEVDLNYIGKPDARLLMGERDLTADQQAGQAHQLLLALLYACWSADGRATAEGVQSMTRAFLASGAQCVISCQWEALADAAAQHCELLCNNLLAAAEDGSPVTVATAFQRAMIAMIEEEGPVEQLHQWACFTCHGNAFAAL